VIGSYPRASDLVLAHALYAAAPFFNFLPAHGKHAVAVLKQERRQLYQDVAGLFVSAPPREGTFLPDPEMFVMGFSGGAFVATGTTPVRVIRSLETYPVRRQLDGKDKVQTSDWIWGSGSINFKAARRLAPPNAFRQFFLPFPLRNRCCLTGACQI